MNNTWITNARIVYPGTKIEAGSILLEAGKIAQIGSPTATPPGGAMVVDAGQRLCTPGLIDLHTHGIGRFFYERDGQDLLAAQSLLPRFGTTCILPTLYRVLDRKSLRKLESLTQAMLQVHDVCYPGFHLEGPFMALPGAGAETLAGDLGLLADLYVACQGKVAAMSLSPDTPNIIPVIEWLVEHHVAVFMTHTQASCEETERAIAAGARHATHFYDVFPLPRERDPGVRPAGAVEAILADRNVSVDFIPDGCHVHPMAIKAALAAKGFGGIVAITDSSIGAGLPPGEYDTTWGYRVRVRPGDGARIADPGHPGYNALAGSSMTMNTAVANLLKWLPLPPEHVWAMVTANPARAAGLRSKGNIQLGADADLVLWNEDLTPERTWVDGRCVFERPETSRG